MVDVNKNNEDLYVCITHQTVCPCDKGDHHLISNWHVDVQAILRKMEKK